MKIQRRKNNSDLDSRGQLSESFDTLAKGVVCSIVQLSGDERIVARQTFPEATHTVGMRYRPGITSKDQLLFGSRTLHVIDVENIDERNRELVLTCGEET